MNEAAIQGAPDGYVCRDCDRAENTYRPMCEHGVVCDVCFPGGCEECIEQLEAEGAL